MTDTKENILTTSLRLFAKNGYEAVSVSMIAGELGMTKGALYRHYKNKRDIFDSIVARMIQLDGERAREYDVPEDMQTVHRQADMQSIREFTIAQYDFWTADGFASDFRKMLALEQYRNEEMNELYQSCIVSGPVHYMEDMFREMIAAGVLKDADPCQLAVEYFAPLFLLIHIADGSDGLADAKAILSAHIDHFAACYLN